MKVEMTKGAKLKRDLNITIPKDKLKDIREKVIKDIQKEAVMPGFRKGNVSDVYDR